MKTSLKKNNFKYNQQMSIELFNLAILRYLDYMIKNTKIYHLGNILIYKIKFQKAFLIFKSDKKHK